MIANESGASDKGLAAISEIPSLAGLHLAHTEKSDL
jgi:hypothetical protein